MKQAFQVCAVNHDRSGGRRLVAIGDAYTAKTGIVVILHYAARTNLLHLVPRDARRARKGAK